MLQANPFPYLAGFKSTRGPELTDATGRFSFSVARPQGERPSSASPWSACRPVDSRAVLRERVAVRVSLHLRSTGRPGFVRLYGTVTPAEAGAPSHSS